MFSYAKFKALCDERGVTPYQIAKETGIATAAFTEWKKKEESGYAPGVGYVPKADKIMLIAERFQVSVDYFIRD